MIMMMIMIMITIIMIMMIMIMRVIIKIILPTYVINAFHAIQPFCLFKAVFVIVHQQSLLCITTTTQNALPKFTLGQPLVLAKNFIPAGKGLGSCLCLQT